MGSALWLGWRLGERRLLQGLKAGRAWIIPLLIVVGALVMGGIFLMGATGIIINYYTN